MLYAADYRFWRAYYDRIASSFRGELWTCSEQAVQAFGTYWVRCAKEAGYNTAPDTVNGGGNSGYQAIHLAADFGAARIVLLGYDMQMTGSAIHWHGPHIKGLPNGRGFAGWMSQMLPLARDLGRMGIEVVNCSRTTALRCFPRQPLEELFP